MSEPTQQPRMFWVQRRLLSCGFSESSKAETQMLGVAGVRHAHSITELQGPMQWLVTQVSGYIDDGESKPEAQIRKVGQDIGSYPSRSMCGATTGAPDESSLVVLNPGLLRSLKNFRVASFSSRYEEPRRIFPTLQDCLPQSP